MQLQQERPLGLERYNLLQFSVLSSTQITTRVSATLSHLKPAPRPTEDEKPTLVLLAGKPGVSNKLITIAEIVKRQLESEKTKVYQYNDLSMESVTAKAPQPKTKASTTDPSAGNEDAEETAFQTMALPEKTHAAPTLSIYLSTTSIDVLKKRFGEQIHPTES